MSSSLRLHAPRQQAPLSSPISQNLLKFMSVESVKLSNHLILSYLLLLLPSIFPSVRVFSNESVLCIRWPKYWSFSFSISPFNEYSGLISFKIDWFDLHAVQARDSRKSSPVSKFKTIKSLALKLMYTKTSGKQQTVFEVTATFLTRLFIYSQIISSGTVSKSNSYAWGWQDNNCVS